MYSFLGGMYISGIGVSIITPLCSLAVAGTSLLLLTVIGIRSMWRREGMPKWHYCSHNHPAEEARKETGRMGSSAVRKPFMNWGRFKFDFRSGLFFSSYIENGRTVTRDVRNSLCGTSGSSSAQDPDIAGGARNVPQDGRENNIVFQVRTRGPFVNLLTEADDHECYLPSIMILFENVIYVRAV